MQPLTGIRVVDLTRNVSGPTVTMILAKLGADVVKVERPPGGDDARLFPPLVGDRSLIFEWCNLGKRSVAIDLAAPDGIAVLRRLCEGADLMIHSFAPGVVERLGIAEDDVRAWQPDILYCGLSAFGDGPTGAVLKGYDPIVQAFTGIMDMTGHPDGPPARCAPSVVDIGNGLWTTIGILAALMSRAQGHPVASLETALVDSALALVPWQATQGLLTGARPERRGAAQGLGAPYDLYQAEDAPVFMAAANQGLWNRVAEVIGAPELMADPRFADPLARVQHAAELKEEINRRLGTDKAAVWAERLNAAGVPSTVVMGIDETVRHPVAGERSWFEDVEGIPTVRLPMLADGEAPTTSSPAPRVGEHTLVVLTEAGYSAEEVRSLVRRGVVFARNEPANDPAAV